MSSIHAPYVPGWDMQLQKHMNRLFTHLTSDKPIYRHNFNFTFKVCVRVCVFVRARVCVCVCVSRFLLAAIGSYSTERPPSWPRPRY